IQNNWTVGQSQQISFDKLIDVPITNGGNQYLVVWVQDRFAKGSSRIVHQSLVSPPIQRQGVKPVGLEDDPIAAEIRDIQIYPNPANNVLRLNLQNQLTRNYTWRMIDQRGITVLDGDVNQFFDQPQEIDISQLANGIYFIQIGIGNTSIIYRKIAVMNRN
ncbi:MAG TPA: T9SS type A sorting domain-containing protein, partial [Saprospiraceae bacterium]|nr:T9SS type A sorting domain-containing protein [Saprospiraceae bacterium]